jgi:hypothetical protein
MNKLLEFLAQGLGGVPGTFTTEDIDPLALLLQGEPKLLQAATPPANDETTRIPTTEWVRKLSGLLAKPQAGLRNLLINGDLSINQRNVTIAAAAVGAFGPDRWKKTAGGMTQVVEVGGFTPGAKHTLSGTGVTTQVLTAPASGNWTLPDVPITATNIQLERGEVATEFEVRPPALEMLLCRRYGQKGQGPFVGSMGFSAGTVIHELYVPTSIPAGRTLTITPPLTGTTVVYSAGASASYTNTGTGPVAATVSDKGFIRIVQTAPGTNNYNGAVGNLIVSPLDYFISAEIS